MKRLKLYLLVIFAALVLALPTSFAQHRAERVASHASPAVLKARGVETISASQMKSYLTFIASDEMEGRDTPSRGLDTTAKFIAMNLGRWGFKPAGDDGTFFQKIALHRDSVDGAATAVELGGQKYNYGEDVVRVSGNSV